ALLQHAEQLGLGVSGQVADLVEEDGAAVGQLEAAHAAADGPGEGALFVAEQLALDQSGRQGGTVDRDEGFLLPPAAGMDRPRDEFLAGPRLARDENRGVRSRDAPDAVEDGRQSRALPDDLLAVVN